MKQLFTSVLLLISAFAFSQNYLHKVLVLNEGYFDYQTNQIIDPVSIGSYDPSTQIYSVVSTLNGMRFGSDLIIDGNFYYVAADSKIYKMDLNTHQEIASVSCVGVRNIGVYQNKLVATRGEYLTTFDSYLHIYDANTLSLIQAIDTISGPKWASQNIVIDGSIAYIAINNGYEWGNEKGLIGKLNLDNLSYGNEVDLGPDGKNPDNLMKSGDFLYTVNNKDWSSASVSKVALNGSSNATVNLQSAATGCGTSALRDDKLVYQISMETTLNEFDINLMNLSGPITGHSINYYELAQEPVSGQLYTSETDFFSFGKIHIFDDNNTELSNFNVGISPGTIVFDVRPSVGLIEKENFLSIYPNPTNENLYLSGFSSEKTRILDLSGKEVISTFEKTVNVSNLKNGAYLLENNGKCYKFIKN
ncbi:MAG: hypothetical protein RL528_1744 [Bacteroidota bacterium]